MEPTSPQVPVRRRRWRANRRRLRQRLHSLVLVAGVLVLLFAIALTASIRARDAALHEAEAHLRPAAQNLEVLNGSLFVQQASLVGFVLSGSPSNLEPFAIGERRVATALADLHREVDDVDAVATTVDAVDAAVKRWQADVVAPQLAAAQSGRLAEAQGLAGPGEAVFADVQREISVAAQRLDVEITEGERTLDTARRLLTWLVALGVFACIVLLLMLIYIVQTDILRPLARLEDQVGRISSGDFLFALDAKGPAEIVNLAEAIDEMRRRIVNDAEEVVAVNEALELDAPATAALRAALAPTTEHLPEELAVATGVVSVEGVLAGDWVDPDVAVSPDGRRVTLAVGDVSGHGPDAAVLALRAKEAIRLAARAGAEPGECLEWTARQLGDTGEAFVTCAVVTIDLDRRTLLWASAGHPPALMQTEDSVRQLLPTGPLLGPLPGRWRTEELPFSPEDGVVICTDGLYEVRDAAGEELGVARCAELVAGSWENGVQAIVDRLLDEARGFAAGAIPDDVTILAVAWYPTEVTLDVGHVVVLDKGPVPTQLADTGRTTA